MGLPKKKGENGGHREKGEKPVETDRGRKERTSRERKHRNKLRRQTITKQ
jgi:hypothetical protein